MSPSPARIFVSALLLLAVFVGCTAQAPEGLPAPASGVLDLRGWQPSDGTVALDGQWEFYWRRFLDPANPPADGEAAMLISVPGMWNGSTPPGVDKPLSGEGYASYRLRILADRNISAAVYAPTVHTAYRLFLNGRELLSQGEPGKNQASSRPLYRPEVLAFPLQRGENELVLHISNFHHAKGGTWTSLLLGDFERLRSSTDNRRILELSLFGALIAMGLYHLMFFALRPSERYLMYFALFCLLMASRSLTTGEHFLSRIWPSIDWTFYVRLQYLGFYLAVPAWAAFIHRIFPVEMPRWIHLLVSIPVLLLSLATLVLPSQWFTATMGFFQIAVVVLGACLFGVFGIACYRGRDGAVLFMIGWSVFFATAVNDVLYNLEILQTVYLTPFGFFLFIFSQAAYLAVRFARAYRTQERFAVELERRVRERTRELEESRNDLAAARERAEAGSRAKSEFLAVMSHEMRTPLNSILGAADLLNEGAGERLDQEQRDYVRVLMRSGDGLLRLVNDVLDLSKIEAGGLVLDRLVFDPQRLVADTCDVFAPAAKEKDLHLHFHVAEDVPLRLIGDVNRIDQVLTNLTGNAVKFTSGGAVRIEVRLLEQRDDARVVIEFSVSDTGIGIPAAKHGEIFESFTQVDSSTTRRYGGTGLGLAISRQLVRLMGGEIGVESEPDRGSTFRFSVPLESSDATLPGTSLRDQKTAHPQPLPFPEGLNILLADDNEDNLNLITAYLKKANAHLDYARNGAEAVDRAKDKRYDLVLMDIQMPVMDGYTATRHIREWEESQGLAPVPILALTAHARKEDIEKSRAVGCNEHLTKPILKKPLWEAIARNAG